MLATTSGIEGQVSIGPVCPVARADQPCNEQPYVATINIQDSYGQIQQQVQSDAQGRFQVSLAAGSYTLMPLSPGRLPRAAAQKVIVQQGTVTKVVIQYDSGIR
ncbi:MAG: hypothetical protein NVSMB42_10950 [Herpetosiphon sp.]